jgi:hypothetical protein
MAARRHRPVPVPACAARCRAAVDDRRARPRVGVPPALASAVGGGRRRAAGGVACVVVAVAAVAGVDGARHLRPDRHRVGYADARGAAHAFRVRGRRCRCDADGAARRAPAAGVVRRFRCGSVGARCAAAAGGGGQPLDAVGQAARAARPAQSRRRGRREACLRRSHRRDRLRACAGDGAGAGHSARHRRLARGDVAADRTQRARRILALPARARAGRHARTG